MLDQKALDRIFDYLIKYSDIISEYWEELKKISKKKRSWDVNINWKKHTYFGWDNRITIINKKNDLEMRFIFELDEKNIFFKKWDLLDFIESDLNANWLWNDFKPNKSLREEIFNECFSELELGWKITKKDNWYLISKEELY